MLPVPYLLAMPHAAGVLDVGFDATRFEQSAHNQIEYEAVAGIDLRGLIGPKDLPLTYAAGLDYRFGVTPPSGFAVTTSLHPIGLGAIVDGVGFLSWVGGFGVSGVSPHLPFAFEWKSEVRLLVDLPGKALLMTWLRAGWLSEAERQDGSRSLDFADEVDALVGVRFGDERSDWGLELGSGVFLGVQARERLGVRGIGLAIGFQIDGLPEASD